MSRLELWGAALLLSAAIITAGALQRYQPAGVAMGGHLWIVDGLTGELLRCREYSDRPWGCRTAQEQAKFDAAIEAAQKNAASQPKQTDEESTQEMFKAYDDDKSSTPQ